jgi:hypothetical protein
MGVFPQAGVADAEIARVRALGATAAARLAAGATGPLLAGHQAVTVKRWLIVPEAAARHAFKAAGHAIRGLGRLGGIPRATGVYAFAVVLVLLILIALPLTLLVTGLAWPLLRPRLEAAAAVLAAPTGEAERLALAANAATTAEEEGTGRAQARP